MDHAKKQVAIETYEERSYVDQGRGLAGYEMTTHMNPAFTGTGKNAKKVILVIRRFNIES